jgi:hypothetical protein
MADIAKKCSRCGEVFYAYDRKMCMECTLIDQDEIRAMEGPTPPRSGNPDFVINAGVEEKSNSGFHRQGYYGERLHEGFAAMKSEI